MKKWVTLIVLTVFLVLAAWLSAPLFGKDLLALQGREATQLLLRLVGVLGLQYVPLLLLSALCKRWWWPAAVVFGFLSLSIAGAGGTGFALVLLLAVPYLASLLSIYAPRIAIDGDGIRIEPLNSDDAKSFWD